MKYRVVFIVLIFSHSITAQIFNERLGPLPLDSIVGGSSRFIDIDGDEDVDLLVQLSLMMMMMQDTKLRSLDAFVSFITKWELNRGSACARVNVKTKDMLMLLRNKTRT